jgi:tRNA threonylcarbamoyladenosine biosynthesis protein TsaE
MDTIAREIISIGPRLILLQGELGAGKTTLVKAFCKVLGAADEVTSPTFTLINEYRDRNDEPIYHMDMYRLSTQDEALQIGVEDYLLSGHWCFIEWPSILTPLIGPGTCLRITLDILPDSTRRIRILK